MRSGSDVLTKQGAFQFNIDIKVPWVMKSFVGGDTATIIERGRVDLDKRVMTLIATNATWGTTVQFVQVVTYTAQGDDTHFAKTITCVCPPQKTS